ncbi:hypothetical protein AMK18_32970 [Streptomyces sp. CB01249]|uniref:hypothetical protein n=1 Tax=Streptomyces sp. CB01249 TaxID=1703929 RepID=UPI00093A9B30|nr:hypothetical protein [Streptomyces sp. CB01249]OKI92079.1 hypothetical protein AMK18_32970 [Streptomyces sp. CB01249]
MVRARGAGASKGLWAAGVVLVAVVVLTVYAMVTGGDDQDAETPAKGGASAASPTASASSSPAATYAPPDDWTEPERWASLTRGKRTDAHGSAVGFPHTVEGAVSMAVAANTSAVEGETSTYDEQMRLYDSYAAQEDHAPVAVEYIKKTTEKPDRDFEKATGAPSGGPLPAGAYMRSNVVGYKIIESTRDEISMWVLARATQKNGEMAKESGSYTRTLVGVQWKDGDWKLGPEALARAMSQTQTQAKPKIVAPGDAAFNSAGWTAIREAS